MKLPKVISTRELQQNIGLLARIPDDEMYLILRTGRIIGVYLPIELFKSLNIEFKIERSKNEDSEFPQYVAKKLIRHGLAR